MLLWIIFFLLSFVLLFTNWLMEEEQILGCTKLNVMGDYFFACCSTADDNLD